MIKVRILPSDTGMPESIKVKFKMPDAALLRRVAADAGIPLTEWIRSACNEKLEREEQQKEAA